MALDCGVQLWVCHFPIGILGHVWYLIVSIPDLCTLTYFYKAAKQIKNISNKQRAVAFQSIYCMEEQSLESKR